VGVLIISFLLRANLNRVKSQSRKSRVECGRLSPRLSPTSNSPGWIRSGIVAKCRSKLAAERMKN
jgi:hypothetical protein